MVWWNDLQKLSFFLFFASLLTLEVGPTAWDLHKAVTHLPLWFDDNCSFYFGHLFFLEINCKLSPLTLFVSRMFFTIFNSEEESFKNKRYNDGHNNLVKKNNRVHLTNWRQFFMRLSCYWSWISSQHCQSSCGYRLRVDPQTTLATLTKFIVNNRTDA